MKIILFTLVFSLSAKASNDYYLDIYDSKKDHKSVEIVFSYKGCEKTLLVKKTDLENTELIGKILKSLKKSVDSGGGCAY